MPQTYREFPVMELALSCVQAHAHRKQEGDIVAVRAPLGMIGTAEARSYVWLLVEGLDTSLMTRLTEPLYAAYNGTAPLSVDTPIVDKRRFCIPFTRLQQVHAAFAPDRARDLRDVYQPFLPIETETYYYRLGSEHQPLHGLRRLPAGLVGVKPLHVHGVVFDKRFMQYLPSGLGTPGAMS